MARRPSTLRKGVKVAAKKKTATSKKATPKKKINNGNAIPKNINTRYMTA